MGMRSRSQRYIERGMKRLVVLNFFPAFYPPRSGGEQRYYYLYRHLSKYYDVTLLSPTFPDARPEVIRFGETFREHRIPKEQVHKNLHAQLDREEIGRECSGLVCALASAEETAYKRACRQLIAAADVIIHDSPFTVEYDEGLGTDRRPRIYNSYNVEAVLARQMFEGPRRDAYIDTVQRLEARLVRCSELVFATSVQEKESFQEMYGCDPGSIVVIANGFEPADASAPRARPPGLDRPFALFLASMGTCAGIYVLGFCRQRGLPTDGIRIIQQAHSNPMTGLVDQVDLEIQVPPTFPEKYRSSLVRSAELCAVKKHLENPPKFNITTQVNALIAG